MSRLSWGFSLAVIVLFCMGCNTAISMAEDGERPPAVEAPKDKAAEPPKAKAAEEAAPLGPTYAIVEGLDKETGELRLTFAGGVRKVGESPKSGSYFKANERTLTYKAEEFRCFVVNEKKTSPLREFATATEAAELLTAGTPVIFVDATGATIRMALSFKVSGERIIIFRNPFAKKKDGAPKLEEWDPFKPAG